MNSTTSENPIIAIAHTRSFEKNEQFSARHLPLVNEIGSLGIQVVALNGAKDRLEGNTFSGYHSFDGGSAMSRHDSPIQIASALDLTGGVARYTPDVAALNPLGVRDIVLSKQSQYDTLKDLSDHVARTVTAPATREGLLDALDEFTDSKLIVKADGDADKVHAMIVGSKDDIINSVDRFLSTMDPDVDKVVVQDYMDEVHSDFASGIKYANTQEREIADYKKYLGRELRVHTIDGRPIMVTGRVGLDAARKSPYDDWLFLDQDSVPSHVTDLAADASRRIMNRAEAADSYLAVDLTPDGTKIVEINGRNIGTMRAEKDRPASDYAASKTTSEIAAKLVAMAHNNSKEQ